MLGLAAGATAAGPAVARPDACPGSGTATITCEGNQSAGILVGSDGVNANVANTLQLGALTKPIDAAGAGVVWDVSGSNTQTTITANIAGGQSITGNGGTGGAGIRLIDGTTNTSTVGVGVGASVGSAAGLAGIATEGGGGAEAVSLAGTATGSIDLWNGTDSVTIASGGRLKFGATLSAETINLDRGGTLSPGGAAKADRVDATAAAVKSGTVTVETIDIGQGGEAARLGVLTASSLEIAAPFTVTPSAVGQFSLATAATLLDLVYDIDFAAVASALDPNERSLARYMARLHARGALDDGFAYLLRAKDAAAYGRLLAPLLPAPYAATGTLALQAADRLTDRLMSCRERAGPCRFVAEGRCLRLDFLATRGFDLRLNAAARWDEQSVSHAGLMGLSYAF